ncbi:sulfotransferase family protein [Novosphingobium album (ex Hu et al. 2023)]|uniref:Sulfotransferase n=1 Tax=Novosphingobium album (ex Hu et al. 2023) TaxID=2930093 RepID=A0ABT0AZN6_9SPHN|nr:sulfotransferase [Novosphingobium album (ex Hu et al. 2023)]MCJ2178282.1 sulfotransferase [Novosphingobium album (ex Hu et al. 2023)]
MTADEVIQAARAQTGLTEFGDPAIIEGLEILLKSYSDEARYSERGSQMAHADLVKWMAIRMKIENWLAKHPELLDAPIEKPMFVFGLPRTGTTLVINLLASDPARRPFLRWESQDPVPPPMPEELHAGPRWEKTDQQTKAALQYMPQIAAIHFEEADSPTECQFLMTPSFCSQVYESQADIPGYREWFLHKADYLPAFRFHKRYLQMLQANAGGRWTLKNPWHPLYLPALKQAYPDAQLVMTHRDPADVLGSIGSLIENVRKIYSDDVDLETIGRQFVETFQIMIERQDAFRAEHGRDSILDVQYAEVMKDPLGQVRAIYDHFDEPFTAEAEAAMQAYMDANPKGKHGKHEYSLERYGLSREGVHKTFADYIERYQIPVKG